MICLLTILAEGSVRMHVLKLSYKWVADLIGQHQLLHSNRLPLDA